MRSFKIYSLRKFQIFHSMLLTIVTMVYIYIQDLLILFWPPSPIWLIPHPHLWPATRMFSVSWIYIYLLAGLLKFFLYCM